MIILIIVVAVMFVLVALFNSIIKAKNQIDNAFGSIDVMLKKRYDLIPNLVDVVKVYLSHEKEVLDQLTKLRMAYESQKVTSNSKVKTMNEIENTMRKLNFSVENYPDLKANQNLIELQKSWNEAEEQIAASRRFFNTAVTEFNTNIQQFPGNIIALVVGFQSMDVFEINSPIERENTRARDMFNS